MAPVAVGIGLAAAIGIAAGTASAGPGCGPSAIEVDDYPELLAALKSVRKTGGAVQMAPGVYQIALTVDEDDGKLDIDDLRLGSNVSLCGAGMDVTVLKWADDVPHDKLESMLGNDSTYGTENITLRDFTLDGRRTGKGDRAFGVRLKGVRNVQIVNVASDGHDDGFYLGFEAQSGKGVDDSRISGCRARANGRNGISLTYGHRNVIDNCRLIDNNQKIEVAGIDLEPDNGSEVKDNIIRDLISEGNNVGIQLFTFNRNRAPVEDNAVCENVVRDNKRAGIYDFNGTNNVYVDNDVSNSGTNVKLDPSHKTGPASRCVNDLIDPDNPPGMRANQVPEQRVVKTSTDEHTLTVEQATGRGKTTYKVVSTVDVGAIGDTPTDSTVKVQFTLPSGKKKVRSARTGNDDTAEARLKGLPGGQYSARVTNITKKGQPSKFQPNASEDEAGPITVPGGNRPSSTRQPASPTPTQRR